MNPWRNTLRISHFGVSRLLISSRNPLPLLLDSLDASEQEATQIEHHHDDRERCFAEMMAAAVRDTGLILLHLCSVPMTGRFVNIIKITSRPTSHCF
ncbi:hypothetical protein [Novipirellula aureliae]|uniref:hypothetical protein n=1 Tax=Novipirellula aureliae TaxID=2527966 RepID=UPI0011B3FF4E|nr:hypothetical protein [Novipirellula aureliae]